MNKISLNDGWTLKGSLPGGKEISVPAAVPGCVHTDLQNAGLAGDFFWRDNALLYREIEKSDWLYTKTFNYDASTENMYLCFEGLDTYCDIYLNGIYLASCENMFIPHKFDVSKHLKCGENLLEVYFRTPIYAGKGRKKLLAAFTSERLYTRRIQCTYGWDWAERFVTCGMWKPVYLLKDDGNDIEGIYIYTTHADESFAEIHAEIEFPADEPSQMLDISVFDDENRLVYSKKMFCNERKRYIDIQLFNPKLWYPNGYGKQPLYTFKLSYSGKVFTERFGIRTAIVVQKPDAEGSDYYNLCKKLQKTEKGEPFDRNKTFSAFSLHINGVPVFCRGGNWVPCEPFVSAETDEKITELLELAASAGVNMLRVWGGGIFEHKHFYNECDRLGIMVTQDFLMACGTYPERDSRFLSHLYSEAKYAAKYLRNHPSLIWWTGDNENATEGNETQENYMGRASFYKAILPAIKEFDPHRPAFASSPYAGDFYASRTVGTTHNTNFLQCFFKYAGAENSKDFKEEYKDYLARFVAEEPTLGAVSTISLMKIMSEKDLADENMDMFYFHTKGPSSAPKKIFDCTLQMAEKVLGKFKNVNDKLFKLRYIQYEWVRISMELARRNLGFCNGLIYWMWNDCWPAAAGWALVDYYCLPKASYYSFKRVAKSAVTSIDKNGDEFSAYVSNVSSESITAKIKLVFLNPDTSDTALFGEKTADIPAYSSEVEFSFKESDLPTGYIPIITAEYNGNKDRSFYKSGCLDIHPAEVEFTKTDEYITVKSQKYIHCVEIEGDAVFEDNYFSLMPSEEKKIRYKLKSDSSPITVNGYTISGNK